MPNAFFHERDPERVYLATKPFWSPSWAAIRCKAFKAQTWANILPWVTLGDGWLTSWWETVEDAEKRWVSDRQTFRMDYRGLKPGMNAPSGASPLMRIYPLEPGEYRLFNNRDDTWKAYWFTRRMIDTESSKAAVLTVLPHGAINPQAKETGKQFCD